MTSADSNSFYSNIPRPSPRHMKKKTEQKARFTKMDGKPKKPDISEQERIEMESS